MRLLFFVLIIVIFIIFIWGCLEGTKATPKLPLYAITAKNKTCKYTMSLHYDIFSSHELLPILHMFGKQLSLPYVPIGKAQRSKPGLLLTKKTEGTLVLKLVLTAKSVLSAM